VDSVNQEEGNVEDIIQYFEVQENPKTLRYVRLNHSEDKIIGDKKKGVQSRGRIAQEFCLISNIEPKNVNESCEDENWVKEMEELN
jgi:hypothetical protein